MSKVTGKEVLKIIMSPEENDVGAHTVGEYLIRLSQTVWNEGESFSGKRPFGNSDWDYKVYIAMGKAGLLDIEFDEYGDPWEIPDKEISRGNELIGKAYAELYSLVEDL